MELPNKPVAYKPLFKFILNVTIYAVMLWGFFTYIDITKPSNILFNSAFAVLFGLAAICFTYSEKIQDNYLSDRLLFAAERIVHGALLIIIASALRFVSISLLGETPLESASLWLVIPIYTLTFIGVFAFNNGMIFAQKGISILSDMLNERMFRYEDWDS